MPAPQINLSAIQNPVVKAAIESMNSKDKKRWYDLFAKNASLTDDGQRHDLHEWSESELFGPSLSYLASIEKVEDGGLTVHGTYHSDQWGEFKTFLKFSV